MIVDFYSNKNPHSLHQYHRRELLVNCIHNSITLTNNGISKIIKLFTDSEDSDKIGYLTGYRKGLENSWRVGRVV